MLEFRRVVKHYAIGNEVVHAVDGVSLDVGAGELVALYGPSGSGKSTLLGIAAAILAPDSGEVCVNGRDITRLSSRAAADYRMRELGFIAQSIELLEGASVVTNAALKLYGMGMRVGPANRRVAMMLEAVGLGHRLKHRPHELSMGERQRVMIVRALSTEPRIVLADEPTGALDSERTVEVLELLRSVTSERGIATLLVTHDPQAVAYADRQYTLRDGALAEGAQPAVPARTAP
ncbi:ABC transporter ATP-binding protein [Baekduia sp. Peel2402]|uniref:ABC transporter ATP-binding protein n=1 Tax=Baekduia sp. Peel2402 TaxID=3458296 RepID=UPI00403ED1DA